MVHIKSAAVNQDISWRVSIAVKSSTARLATAGACITATPHCSLQATVPVLRGTS